MLDTIAMAAQLKGEYKSVFEKADMYGSLENGDDESVNDDKMMNLYDLLMQAQADQTPVSKIIGDDLEEFCKSYFDGETEKTPKWFAVVKFIYNAAWWGVIAGLLEVLWPEEENVAGFLPRVDIMPLIIGTLFGFGLVFLAGVAKKTILKSKKIKPIVFYITIVAVIIASIVASIVVSTKVEYTFMVKANLLFIFSGIYVAVYLIVRSVWRYRDHGSIGKYTKEESRRRKDEKKEKEAFNKDVAKRNVAQTAKDMKFRYKRLSRRHEKKYGVPLTLEQYKEKLTKELDSFDKLWIVYLIIDVVIVLGPTIQVMVSDGLGDGILYGVIMAVVFYFIYRFQKWTDKVSRDAYYEMLYVLDLCITHNLDLETVGEAAESGIE